VAEVGEWVIFEGSFAVVGDNDRAGQVKRWSTEMEILVLQKWQESGERRETR